MISLLRLSLYLLVVSSIGYFFVSFVAPQEFEARQTKIIVSLFVGISVVSLTLLGFMKARFPYGWYEYALYVIPLATLACALVAAILRASSRASIIGDFSVLTSHRLRPSIVYQWGGPGVLLLGLFLLLGNSSVKSGDIVMSAKPTHGGVRVFLSGGKSRQGYTLEASSGPRVLARKHLYLLKHNSTSLSVFITCNGRVNLRLYPGYRSETQADPIRQLALSASVQ